MKRWKSIPVLFCLLLLSSACLPSATPEVNPRGPGTPTLSDEAVLGTKVAATLTAILPASSPVADTPQPGTPEATSPPAASPTSLQPTKAQPTLTTPVAMAAYAREGVVYLWTEGTIRPLTSTGTEVFTVILSDDGRWVAYTRQVDDLRQEIWAVQTGGMDGERLMSSADFAAIDPAALAVLPNQIGWVPGSHTLAFNTHQVFEGPGVSPYDDLHLIDVDTFERRTPFLAGEGGDFYFSPDGTQVALSTPTQIDLVNLDGSNRRPAVLTFEMVLTYSEYMISPPVTWAADSSMVWAAIPPHDALGAPPQITTVWQIPVEGSPAVKTAEFQAAPLVGFELPVSPDTQHLVYLAETGEQPDIQYELHLAALDGSSNQILHTAPFMDFLSWSPDGQRFAVSVGNEQALYLGEAAGSFAPAPGSPAGVSDLDWMDEAQFVYVQTGAGGASLVHGAVTGTPQVMDSLNGGFIPYSVR